VSSRDDVRQATERRVLAAADQLFRQRGFSATTIRDIAEASGVSTGTVMAAGDKNALLVRVFDGLVAAGQERPAPAVGSGTGACADRILELVQPFVTLFVGRQDLSRTYASILVSGHHSSALFTDLSGLLVGEIRETIRQHGCTPDDRVGATADALYFAYIGTLFSGSARETVYETEVTDSLRATFAAICTCEE